MFELKISTEGAIEEDGTPKGHSCKVLWLNFKSSNGGSGAINLNNLANERGSIVGNALRGAILEYFKQSGDGITGGVL